MRFGLIGLGSVGQIRKTAVENTPGCELTAVFDINPNISKNESGGVKRFNTVEELILSDSCDSVIISSPPNFHKDQAIAAMKAGKHVLVEKPMASSLADCREMIDISVSTGRQLTVGFNHRYFDAVKAVRTAIQSEEIGKLSYLRAYSGHTGLSEFKSPWMYDKDIMGGGTLVDNGIHVLDLTCHLMGGVESVFGIVKNDIWKLDRSEDNAFALLRSSEGVVATLHSSWTEWKGYHFCIEAYGESGMARLYYAPMMSTVITVNKKNGKRSAKRNFYISAILREKLNGWQSTVVKTFVEELSQFKSLVETGKKDQVIATAEDGFRTMEVANAVYESSRTGTINILNGNSWQRA